MFLIGQERMQELEREKDTLQLQVTVLEDQIENQSRRLAEIGTSFGNHLVTVRVPTYLPDLLTAWILTLFRLNWIQHVKI